MNIRILPDTLINQIAAGEVVERPSSALKEIAENAIDAGANRLEIVVEAGGKNLIRVTDNGLGMTKGELELAIERHATSKLSGNNLLDIASFGFRGEALPSIGAIAKLCITSRSRCTDEAWKVAVEGGKKQPVKPSQHEQGTTVEIRDLFFATPARLKFLKTDKTEEKACLDVVQRLAMAYPDIAFKLNINDKILLDISASEQSIRLRDILGKNFAENSIPIDFARDDVTLYGMVGLPTLNISNSLSQYLFVNNRPVKDKLLLGAIRGAYQDFLASNRYPMLALFIDIPSELLDVNVHPAKTEVRFRDSATIRGMIVGGIKRALADAGHQSSNTVSMQALSKFQPLQQPQQSFSGFQSKSTSNYMSAGNYNPPPVPQEIMQPIANTSEYIEPQIDSNFPLGAARAQLHKTYIVSQTDDSIVVVDQHAAHERLVYEKMKQQMAESGIKRQALLIPEIVELAADQAERIISRTQELANFGIIIEPFGENAITVKETPALFGDINCQTFIQQLAEELEEFGQALSLQEKFEHICGTIACHSSVRAGRILNPDEMNALLRQMEATPYSGQCNHGRPTYIELKLSDIERLFGRTG